ncbi:hypothetical protein IAE22_36735, partial [Bacillus sp. S34]|nr:hypothetical protein [Bacillus sp. S34]
VQHPVGTQQRECGSQGLDVLVGHERPHVDQGLLPRPARRPGCSGVGGVVGHGDGTLRQAVGIDQPGGGLGH